MNGTKIKNIRDNKKINREILKSFSFFKDERQKIIIVPKNINIKCLKKKV